ncbi:transposase [soil metagenome]
MARLARLVVAGQPHLVVQRGNNRQPVFVDAEDQTLYLDALREVARVHSVAIHAYALLESEVRLLATPSAVDGLSKMMQALGRRYVGAFNLRHGRTGTPWDGRFRATVIESATWLVKCMVFIENSAVMAPSSGGATTRSSAPHHLARLVDPLVWEHEAYWSLGNTPFEREAAYKLLLENGLGGDESAAIAAASVKGWPLGSDSYIGGLAQGTPRRLVPLKRGRRPKSVQSDPN